MENKHVTVTARKVWHNYAEGLTGLAYPVQETLRGVVSRVEWGKDQVTGRQDCLIQLIPYSSESVGCRWVTIALRRVVSLEVHGGFRPKGVPDDE